MPAAADLQALLPTAVHVVQNAGGRVKDRFSRLTRPSGREDINRLIGGNDAVSLEALRPGLLAARPGANWAEDELGAGALPPGEWWVTDPVEGAINHIHGTTDWCVTATLVRDNLPVLTVVHLPLNGETYTALRGGGAFVDGKRLAASRKADLGAAIVGTGQARPGEASAVKKRLGRSVAAMLEEALVVRMQVPATWLLIQVAAGHMDAFWQFSQVRSGLLAGALLVQEAGGILTDTDGEPWTTDSKDFLAAAPSLHAQAVAALAAMD